MEGAWIRSIAPFFSSPERRLFLRLKIANAKATKAYRAQVFDGAITLIRCSKRASLPDWDKHLKWADLATRGFDCHVVCGKHRNIFQEPNVFELARQVNECLSHAQKSEDHTL